MAKPTIPRPGPGEYAPVHASYVAMVPDGDVFTLLKKQPGELTRLLKPLGGKGSSYRYAPGKWSIREALGHMIDAERVFTYRALTFARADRTALPGFDESAWAAASNAHDRTLKGLLEEFASLREATLNLFLHFTPEQFSRTGVASGHAVSVRGLLYVTAGHVQHHVHILRERYLTTRHAPKPRRK